MRSSSIGCARAHVSVGDRAREGELGVGYCVYLYVRFHLLFVDFGCMMFNVFVECILVCIRGPQEE